MVTQDPELDRDVSIVDNENEWLDSHCLICEELTEDCTCGEQDEQILSLDDIPPYTELFDLEKLRNSNE